MTELQPYRRGELTVHDGREHAPTRTDQAVAWVGWHIAELAAIGLPLLLAVTVAWWLAGISVLAGALWVGHEATRRQRGDKTEGRPLQAVPSGDTSDVNGEGIA
ncbi:MULTISPECIES: hypothetical protein [Prauserella salsuginis group]|uniref:Uncharacterized protein n=1 Tax=Prauserella salsuginis TaxID=387889 RepID=A0ABW6G276_9PSEU|nr:MULTISPECIES: hypothetical protein [Prauserella salsuginis group]MCR3719925.1 hypothetical protein [Prauserella flava]MCR3736531.1 hypothetical protein [Prauserella salsuginis]